MFIDSIVRLHAIEYANVYKRNREVYTTINV